MKKLVTNTARTLSIVALCVTGGQLIAADETPEVGAERQTPFGGPSSPEVFLNDIERRVLDDAPEYVLPGFNQSMETWFDLKKDLESESNLRLGGHYQYVTQKADKSLEEPDYSSGGLFRGTSTWTPGGRENLDASRFVFTLDHRHRIGNGVAPSALGAQIGYQGTTSAIMGNSGFDVVKLAWVKPFKRGKSGFAVGRIDPNEHFYTHGFSNPWAGFMNNEVVNSPSVAQPQTSWTLVTGNYFTDQIYGVAGISDANGTAQDNLEWFSGGSEFFSAIELGYVPSQAERLQRKISVTAWHVDERVEAEIGDGQGLLIAASWNFGTWNTFTRVGWSDGTAPVYESSFLVGFIKQTRNDADDFGIASSWGESSTGLGAQSATEVFYNYYLAKNLAWTFDFQFINNPLLNPRDDEVYLVGTRLRFTF